MSDRAPVPAIELRIRENGQLFHTLDPLPFRERDLDGAVEEYVVGWARELPRGRPLLIVLPLPAAEARRPEAAEIGEALRRYFAYRAEMTGLELKELFRLGRTSLLVGLAVLATCVLGGRLAGELLGDGWLGRFLEEGLVILGWVANWRPIQIFLYDWQPLLRRQRLQHRLARATVTLEAGAG